jgi:hypothetical protein
MKAQFSEFSYGFAVTDELINWRGTNLTAAPYFPSLIREGKLGYDLRLNRPGIPLFIQFKRSEYISRLYVIANEFSVFSSPFYRMHITPLGISKQHDLLCDFEERGNEIYYVAPVFWKERDFNDIYISRTICDNSVFVSPLNIGRITDYDKHHISFQNVNGGYRFSDPVRLELPLNLKRISERIAKKLEIQRSQQKFGEDYWVRLNREIEEILQETRYLVERTLFPVDTLRNIKSPLERIALLSQIYFGSQFYIANFKEDLTNEGETETTRHEPLNSTIH